MTLPTALAAPVEEGMMFLGRETWFVGRLWRNTPLPKFKERKHATDMVVFHLGATRDNKPPVHTFHLKQEKQNKTQLEQMAKLFLPIRMG